MAHYGDKYGSQTDEYGNPIGGVGHHGTTGPYMNHPGATTTTGGGLGTGATGVGLGTGAGHLRRSGSSSSSSSEDDGMGGRRKKGLKDKIKEKLPGGHKDEQGYAAGTAPGGGAGYGHEQAAAAAYPHQEEKKGMMDKIKDKLPGTGHH